MTTIVAVKKEGKIVIAADTLVKANSETHTTKNTNNFTKIIPYGEAYIGTAGSISIAHALDVYCKSDPIKPLADRDQIMKFYCGFCKFLQKHYPINIVPGDAEETGMNDLGISSVIASPSGIFTISELFDVLKYSRFVACGNGNDYAMGAMEALYKFKSSSASSIAKAAIEAAAEFDDCTGLPVHICSIDEIDLDSQEK